MPGPGRLSALGFSNPAGHVMTSRAVVVTGRVEAIEGMCVTVFRSLLLASLCLGLAAPPTLAAAKKPAPKAKAKPAAKPAAAKPAEPAVEAPAAVPGGFMVPKEVVLKNPTQAEREANAVWNIRAALNVAALQCQYSGWLKTTRNYNSFLQAHSEELVRAQQTMTAHFKRTQGAKAVNAFDMYTTRTYNSYSTLDAQYAFCNAAGEVGRHVLAVPKGKLGAEALARGPAIRAALANNPLAPALLLVLPDQVAVPPLEVADAS
jgi:hypothetical protein